MGETKPSDILSQLAEELASAVPVVDAEAEHRRWKPGIGPFEEEKQMEMLIEQIEDSPLHQHLVAEQVYPEVGQRCDLVFESDSIRIPIEAKLLRFRYDNGNIDPASYARIFTPFPERSSSSLLTDARKLYQSAYGLNGGLLGLYYEKEDEEYEQLDAETIAEKFCIDIDYWYEFNVKITNISYFDGLRHPHHQRGAVIIWEIIG